VLRKEGLTDEGLARLQLGNTRCRISAKYKALFDPKFPEFRLPTVVDCVRAADIVRYWAEMYNMVQGDEAGACDVVFMGVYVY